MRKEWDRKRRKDPHTFTLKYRAIASKIRMTFSKLKNLDLTTYHVCIDV